MTRFTCAWLAIGLSLGLIGCTDDEEPFNALTVVSYNGGMALGFVPAAEERLPLTTEAVAGITADLICVQEFWTPEQIQALETAVAGPYPHTTFVPDDAGTVGPAACTTADLEDLETCVYANGCDQVCGDELVQCALGNCGTEYNNLPDDCTGCINANIGKPIEDILSACVTESTEYAFGGAFGIGFLSSLPLQDEDRLVFDATTTRRAVLYAKVATPLGEVHAFCTHLNAIYSDVAYPKPTGSWEEEQAAQIADLLAFIDEKAGSDGPVVLMGDMNSGPDGVHYDPDYPDSYELLVGDRFTSPYADNADSQCTFCQENPLTGTDHDDSSVIDHVLLDNLSGTAKTERILDQPITVHYCGADNDARYSDHYGVRVTIEQPK